MKYTPLPSHILYQTYSISGPIYKKIKAKEDVTTIELTLLAEFFMFTSILNTINRISNSRYIDEGYRCLTYAIKNQHTQLTPTKIKLLRRGYIAACISLESSYMYEYGSAVQSIQRLHKQSS